MKQEAYHCSVLVRAAAWLQETTRRVKCVVADTSLNGAARISRVPSWPHERPRILTSLLGCCTAPVPADISVSGNRSSQCMHACQILSSCDAVQDPVITHGSSHVYLLGAMGHPVVTNTATDAGRQAHSLHTCRSFSTRTRNALCMYMHRSLAQCAPLNIPNNAGQLYGRHLNLLNSFGSCNPKVVQPRNCRTAGAGYQTRVRVDSVTR